ncbi:MAG: hypothetical protein K0U47_00200 [Epsilonproteobacteria bacterium]|nr:hypothetical protein [Campylobacterota bacterium]
MFKKSLRFAKLISAVGFLIMLFAIPSFAAVNKHLAVVYTIKGDVEDKYNKLIEEKIKKIDYSVSDPHKRINDAYKKKYGESNLDLLSFMTIANEKVVKPMFNIDPRIAGFNPFNLLIYKKLDQDTTQVVHLMPETILDVIGITDEKVRSDYIKSFEPLDKMIQDELGGEISYIDIEEMADDRMMNFEIEFEAGADLEDIIDDFQMEFEEKFEENKYIIAGFMNFKETDGEDTIPGFDAFWTYSLCHFTYSYTVFDNEGGRPEAGIFAPCTMYMYIKEGSNKIVVGMPRLENWGKMLGIKDKKRADFIKHLDTEIPALMKELGAVETENVNPLLATAKAEKKDVKKVVPTAPVATPAVKITNPHLAIVYEIKGDVEAKYNNLIEEKIKDIGYRVTDPHKRVNDAYKKKYGTSNLDILSFMTITNENVVKPMFNVDPRIAGFNPFNMLIYKKLDDQTTKVAHLMPEAILDIIGISDPQLRSDYIKSFEPLDKMIKEELGGEVSYIDFKKMADKRMMNFEVEFEAGEDLEDIIDDFQMEFEEKFEENKYIIAGFMNYKETDGEDTIPDYDAFWTYSLCHFQYSYTIFDNEGGRPEAGLFAPCTMYMYIKKGTNKIVVGMPRLDNWNALLGVEGDKVRTDFMKHLDTEIPTLLKELGAIETENINPLLVQEKAPEKEVKIENEKPANSANSMVKKAAAVAVATAVVTAPVAAEKSTVAQEIVSDGKKTTIQIPKAPEAQKPLEVVTVGGSTIKPREHQVLSTKMPENVQKPSHATEVKLVASTTPSDLGMTQNGRVPAYLRGAYAELSVVKKALESAGFKILSQATIDKKGLLTSIVFTNESLEKLANKKDRGFMASLRILLDNDNKQLTLTNPLYFSRAFMQDDHDEKVIKGVLTSLTGAFGGLKASKDNLKYTLLPKYQFMFAMPYYEDMIEVGEADSSQALLAKIKAKKGGENLIFAQELSKDRILLGVKLGKRTSKFIGKIGTENALLLPYPVLLENGVAKILDPKYYIAISYPMLKMSQFMKISTVPGAIQSDCEKLFK